MEKKKMKLWKKILIVVLIIIAIFAIDTLRKFCILKNVQVQYEADSKSTNYYCKMNTELDAFAETWIYGNISLYRHTSYNEKGMIQREIYKNKDTKQSLIIVKEPDKKTVVHLEYSEDSIPTTVAGVSTGFPMSNETWQLLQLAAMTRISNTNSNGFNRYEISFGLIDEGYTTYVNKEDNRILSSINGAGTDKDGNKYMNITNYFYKYGTVTEKDVELPDFTGYIVKDNSGNIIQ